MTIFLPTGFLPLFVPTIPDIDAECEILSQKEALNQINNLPSDMGLHIVMWARGVGEGHYFIRRVAPILAEQKPLEYFDAPNGGVMKYPLRSARELIKNDDTQDILMTPTARMPKWGDGSAYYRCHKCHQPIIEEERTFDDRMNARHESCFEDE